MNMSRILFRISQKYLRISQLLKTYYLYTKTHTWDFHDIFIIVCFFFFTLILQLKKSLKLYNCGPSKLFQFHFDTKNYFCYF
jgi:hypothetical protein